MNKNADANYKKIPKSISQLVLLSFLVFPATIFLGIFGLLDMFSNPFGEAYLLPKLDDFLKISSNEDIINQNNILINALLIPYYLIFIWIILFFILKKIFNIKTTAKKDIKFRKLINIFVVILVLIALSFFYSIGDLRFSRYTNLNFDYSNTMTVDEYVSWQVKIYLFVSGLWAAITILAIASTLSFNKDELK